MKTQKVPDFFASNYDYVDDNELEEENKTVKKKQLKLAVLRSESTETCPFGLEIPFGCHTAGRLIQKMKPLLRGQSPEENQNLLAENTNPAKCFYAGNIIEEKYVDCNAPNLGQSFPIGSPKFYRPMGGAAGPEGLNTVPLGYYADNSIDIGHYYGPYSMEGIASIEAEFKTAVAFLASLQRK